MKKNPVKEFKDSMQNLVDNGNIDSITMSTNIDGKKKEVIIAEKKTTDKKTTNKKEEYKYPTMDPKMKYNFTSKLHLACADDEMRPVMECVHFKNGYAYASDGHILIKQSLEYHAILNPKMLEGKSIHKKSFKEIMTFRIAEAKEDCVSCSDGDREADFMYADCGKAPNFESVIPIDEPESKKHFGANAKFVGIAGEILHGSQNGCLFTFKGKDKVILTTMDYSDQLALIMLIVLEPALF
jgi:hypothetical protein